MSNITKRSLLRNRTFSAKNRFKMQAYLNKMSANGMHVSEIRKGKTRFTEDASVRYIYSICGQGEDALYTEKSGWAHFCNYLGVSFFRRAVPADAVKLVRIYKKNQARLELSWLQARLNEGLLLIGKIGDEYIFSRTDEYKNHEYIVRQVKKQKQPKDGTAISPLGDTSGLTFICASSDGSVYYFIKNTAAKDAVNSAKGRRLSDQIFSIFVMTGAAIGFCASAFFAVLGLLNGGALMLPLAICGGAGMLLFTALFVLHFKKFQKIGQARRIYKQEKRLEQQSKCSPTVATQRDEKISEPQSNTVVMNTVVMNNYGEQHSAPPAPASGYGEALSPTENPFSFARSVMDNVRYGEAADTLVQGDVYRPSIAPAAEISDSDITYGAWENEADEPEKQNTDNQAFPLVFFIFSAVICFAAAMMMILGLRFGISYFVNFGKENPLSLLLSLMGVMFSPFIFKFGFTSCKDILDTHAYEDDE